MRHETGFRCVCIPLRRDMSCTRLGRNSSSLLREMLPMRHPPSYVVFPPVCPAYPFADTCLFPRMWSASDSFLLCACTCDFLSRLGARKKALCCDNAFIFRICTLCEPYFGSVSDFFRCFGVLFALVSCAPLCCD